MNRSEMREQAFTLLFEREFFKDLPLTEIEDVFSENIAPLSDYAKELFEGTVEHIEEFDSIVSNYSKDWKINRIPKVNLSILRLALYEIIYVESVPENVAINEAIELTKKYSGKEDSAYVNGILGSYSRSK